MGVAYYAQHALEGMTESNTVLQEIDTVTPKWTVPQQRSLLGAFLFSDNDSIEKQVRVLSGGEKRVWPWPRCSWPPRRSCAWTSPPTT